ncbi:MAG: hypothetical protein WDN66_02995 [Candidatus Saccharibacteria bacterium]
MQEDKVNTSVSTGTEKPSQPSSPLTQEQINALLEIQSPRKKDSSKWVIGLILAIIVVAVGFSSWAISHYLSKVNAKDKTNSMTQGRSVSPSSN